MPIYGWIVGKYGGLFKEMPQKTSTYHADILAYHVAVNYDPDNHRMNMHGKTYGYGSWAAELVFRSRT